MTQCFRLQVDQKVLMRNNVALSVGFCPPATGDRLPALLIRKIYNNADQHYLH